MRFGVAERSRRQARDSTLDGRSRFMACFLKGVTQRANRGSKLGDLVLISDA